MIFNLARTVTSNKVFLAKHYSTVLPNMSGRNIGISLDKVICILEKFAPKHFSESWDNTGLLVEPFTKRNIKKIMLTNDLTEDVVFEGLEEDCEMIISYHPPIFAPLKSVVQKSWKERIVSILLENRIALYSPHTSWDSVSGGVNDWLAAGFAHGDHSVPILPGSEPHTGAGRLLTIPEITLSDAITRIKLHIGLEHVRLALAKGKNINDKISTVALCAGSGSSVLKGVSADLYLTGEMLHHDVLDATQNGIHVILTNHSDSERGFLHHFQLILEKYLSDEAKVIVSKRDRDPLTTV